jgi:hypothetical protein
MEGIKPGAPLRFGNRAHLDGDLGAALSHVGVEAVRIGLDRKEAARPHVDDPSTLKEQWQSPHQPAVDGRRIRGRSDDAAGHRPVGVREGCHIGVEIEDPQPSACLQDSGQLRDGSLPPPDTWDSTVTQTTASNERSGKGN